MDDRLDRSQYWFEIAEYDLETARVMLEGGRFLYVGFMCHQAIEKALKGYFAEANKQTPPFKHNLTLLAEKNGLNNGMASEQKELLDMLEPLHVEARYPTYKKKLLESLNKERCAELIVRTEELMSWIKGKLPR